MYLILKKLETTLQTLKTNVDKNAKETKQAIDKVAGVLNWLVNRIDKILGYEK